MTHRQLVRLEQDSQPFSPENPLLIKGGSWSLGQHWTMKHGPPNPKTMMPPVIPPSPVDTSVWGNGSYAAINDSKMEPLMENEVSDYDRVLYNPRFPQTYASKLEYDPDSIPRFKYPYRPSVAQPSLPDPVAESSLQQYVQAKQELKTYQTAWPAYGKPIGVLPERFANTFPGLPREGYVHIDNPLASGDNYIKEGDVGVSRDKLLSTNQSPIANGALMDGPLPQHDPFARKMEHMRHPTPQRFTALPDGDDHVYSAPGVIETLNDRVGELSGGYSGLGKQAENVRESYSHISPPRQAEYVPDNVYLPSRAQQMKDLEHEISKDDLISEFSGRAITSRSAANPLGPRTTFPTYSPEGGASNYFRDEVKKGLDYRMSNHPESRPSDGKEYYPTAGRWVAPQPPYNLAPSTPQYQGPYQGVFSSPTTSQLPRGGAPIGMPSNVGLGLPPRDVREGFLKEGGVVSPSGPNQGQGNPPPQLGMLYDPMLNNQLADSGMFTHTRDTSLPSTLQVEGNDDRFKHSDQFYYRQSRVEPNFMTSNEIIEPINANNGISYLPQRYDLIDEVGPTSLNHYSYTRYDPQLVRQEEDLPYGRAVENPTRNAWSQHLGDTMAPPGSIDISQIYDPRFTGYGDGFRAYEDIKSGRLRYYYRNVDAYKYPLFVAKNKVDHLDMYTPTGEVWARYNLEADPDNYREVVEDQYTQDDLFHREDLMSKQLQPFFRRQWQLRIAPKRPAGTATYA